MTDRHTFARIARRLEVAALGDDWSTLAAADRELAAVLQGAAARRDLSAADRDALLALRKAHDGALARCVEASERIAERLSELGAGRDGWMAYAYDLELSGSHS